MVMIKGKCHICGQTKELTFEHIPPRITGNKGITRAYDVLELIKSQKLPWNPQGLRYKQQMGGTGGYTLCKSCNDFTGQKYVRSFNQLYQQLASQNVMPIGTTNFKEVWWHAHLDVKPLDVAKEILAMFASVCHPELAERNHAQIRRLIINPDLRAPKNFKDRLYLFLTKTNMQRRFGPMAGLNLTNHEVTMVAGVDAFPLSFLMEFGTNKNGSIYLDITSWLQDYGYGEIAHLDLRIPCVEANNIFPGDHRTKNQIASDSKRI